jgi:hypothetical protein
MIIAAMDSCAFRNVFRITEATFAVKQATLFGILFYRPAINISSAHIMSSQIVLVFA